MTFLKIFYMVSVYLMGLCLLNSVDCFLNIRKNPELNAILHKNQKKFQEQIKMKLSVNASRKYNLNDEMDDHECFDLNDISTIMNEHIEATFYNVKICGLENQMLMDFETELDYGAATFKFVFQKIYLRADSYTQMFGSQSSTTYNGFRLVLENVIVDGATGLSVEDESLRTSTWTHDILPEQIYFEWPNSTESTLELNQTQLSVNPLGRHLIYEANKIIRRKLATQINDALAFYPIIPNVLDQKKALLGEYKSQVLTLSKFANNFIDNLLEETNQYIIENDQQIASLPNFETQFSRKYGPLTVWGEFFAQQGYVSDLSTIQRTANFTILPLRKAKMIKVFGALGLEKLDFGYHHYEARIWRMGPTGKIRATTGANSLAFYFKGGYDPKKGDVDVKMFDVNVVEFEDVDIKATGMHHFNWLYSKVLTMAAENAKDDIIPIIEQQLRDTISRRIYDGLTISGFDTTYLS